MQFYSLRCVTLSVVNFTPTFECLKLLFCHLMMDQSVTALFISMWYNLESVGSQRRNDNLDSQNCESRRPTLDVNAHYLLLWSNMILLLYQLLEIKRPTGSTTLYPKPKLMILPPTIEYFQEHVKRSHLQAATELSVLLSEPLDFI